MSDAKIELENLGSLITVKGTEPPQCLGHLMHFEGRGTFEPSLGLIEVSKADADTHNSSLDAAMVKGLLENCKIGQGGCFYLTENKDETHHRRYKITTFTGTVVSEGTVHVAKTGRRNKYGGYWLEIYFEAGGKGFKGKNNGDDQLVEFKRVR